MMNIKKITRKYNRLTLYLQYHTDPSWHAVGVYFTANSEETSKNYHAGIKDSWSLVPKKLHHILTAKDYHAVIKDGWVSVHKKPQYISLQEYLWLLRWKPLLQLYQTSLPQTLNLKNILPDTPPPLSKKSLTLQEKEIIRRLQ